MAEELPTCSLHNNLLINYVSFSGKQSMEPFLFTWFMVTVKLTECMEPYSEHGVLRSLFNVYKRFFIFVTFVYVCLRFF